MPSTGSYSLSLLTTIKQGLDRLEKQLVDPIRFMQLLNDNRDFRDAVVREYMKTTRAVLFGLPETPQNLDIFIAWIYGKNLHTEDGIRNTYSGYGSRVVERELQKRQDFLNQIQARVDYYRDPTHFGYLFLGLSDHAISLVVMHLGLSNGFGVTVQAVANAHRISATFCRETLSDTRAQVLKFEEGQISDDKAQVLTLPVEALELSIRTTNVLRRAQNPTIGLLIQNNAEDLLRVSGMGKKSLDEIIEKLAERGLSLKQ